MSEALNQTQILWMMKGAISDMPEEDQTKIALCHEHFKSLIAEYPVHAKIAFGLLASELAIEEGINE